MKARYLKSCRARAACKCNKAQDTLNQIKKIIVSNMPNDLLIVTIVAAAFPQSVPDMIQIIEKILVNPCNEG